MKIVLVIFDKYADEGYQGAQVERKDARSQHLHQKSTR